MPRKEHYHHFCFLNTHLDYTTILYKHFKINLIDRLKLMVYFNHHLNDLYFDGFYLVNILIFHLS